MGAAPIDASSIRLSGIRLVPRSAVHGARVRLTVRQVLVFWLNWVVAHAAAGGAIAAFCKFADWDRQGNYRRDDVDIQLLLLGTFVLLGVVQQLILLRAGWDVRLWNAATVLGLLVGVIVTFLVNLLAIILREPVFHRSGELLFVVFGGAFGCVQAWAFCRSWLEWFSWTSACALALPAAILIPDYFSADWFWKHWLEAGTAAGAIYSGITGLALVWMLISGPKLLTALGARAPRLRARLFVSPP